jgi:uncharacterized protein
VKIIRKSEFVKGLWRNGRGVSWNIASAPSSGTEEFGWRLALADIAEAGAFSLYGPVDRVFTLVEGNGVELEIGGGRLIVSAIHVPHAFPCDVKTNCAHIDGPCRALNLFTARQEWQAAAEVVAIAEIADIECGGGPCVLFLLKGDCSIATHGLVQIANEGDALVLPPGTGSIAVAAKGAVVFVGRLSAAS